MSQTSKKIFGSRPVHKKYNTNVIAKNPTVQTNATTEQTQQNLQIQIINDADGCKTWIPTLKSHCNEINILGFDCEWISMGARKPVALLQLATHRGLCLLIRLCLIQTIPDDLKKILEDETIIKVGVIPSHDANYLEQDYGVRTKNTLDISYLVQLAGCEVGGLKFMAERYLNLKWKENYRFHALWEEPTLSKQQIEYAAKDAFVAVELFKLFSEKLQPKRELEDQKTHTKQIISTYCEKYLDVNFKKEYPEFKDIIPREPSAEIDSKMISNVDDCQSWTPTLKSHCEEFNVLGIQYVSSANGDRLQLATYQGFCMIVDLCELESIPIELKEMLEDEHIVKVGSGTFNQVRSLLRNQNTFVTSVFDIRLLVGSLKYPNVQLERLCEVFLDVEFNADSNAAYVNMELFKLFAEQLQPKQPDENEKTHMQHTIQKYTCRHLNLKYIGDMRLPKALTVIVNDLDTYSLLMPTLNLHCEEYGILGIDWTFKEKRRPEKGEICCDSVALIHLTTHRGVCAIINLCHLQVVPEQIKELLENDKIAKVGINPMKIGEYLFQNYSIRVKSTLDIRHVAKLTGSTVGYLKTMCETYLGHYYAEYKMPSSWANDKFKDKELEFAARDSHQATELFKVFHGKLIRENPVSRLQSVVSLVGDYLDVYFADYTEAKLSNLKHVGGNGNRNRNWNK